MDLGNTLLNYVGISALFGIGVGGFLGKDIKDMAKKGSIGMIILMGLLSANKFINDTKAKEGIKPEINYEEVFVKDYRLEHLIYFYRKKTIGFSL